jgi:hypothetical protein
MSESTLFDLEPGLFEIALQISLLPSISRGTHLAGPRLHAERLVELWRPESAVSLAQAFRLLDVSAVERVIQQSMAAGEYGDSRHWQFPEFEQLLPPLRDLVWQEVLADHLTVEGTSAKGTRRALRCTEAQDLEPDWPRSRLLLAGRCVFADAEAWHVPTRPAKKSWQKPPSQADLKDEMEQIACTYPAGATPSADEIWDKLKVRWPELTRAVARQALKDYAPQLIGRRGYRPKK